MEQPATQHRIVFHLATPDPTAHRSLISQLNNVLAVWPTALLEVVIHNKGIDFMRQTNRPLLTDIAELHGRGVVFAVCENTLRSQQLTPADLAPQATFVPVALAELVLKQEAGWSYIKAGY